MFQRGDLPLIQQAPSSGWAQANGLKRRLNLRAELGEVLELAFTRVVVIDWNFACNKQLEILNQAIVVGAFVGLGIFLAYMRSVVWCCRKLILSLMTDVRSS
ncbi:conserved hypothetical protein [Xenorhabdus nematophila F1]|nr:conserved hypothetical protein [Xenorhabdus nematophila F1]